jgi:hypothetical protein
MPGQFINSGNGGKVTLANNSNAGKLTISKAGGGGTTYTIGQTALGGIIAYINGGGSTGTSGLVASIGDVSSNAQFGCNGTSIATSTSLGTGNANTNLIIANCSTFGIAARVCADYTDGTYTDWYLPSIDELSELWTNRAAIGGFDPFGQYGSSSQAGASTQWVVNFNSGAQVNSAPKFIGLKIRAIRSF